MSLHQSIISGTLSQELLNQQRDKIDECNDRGYTPLALAVVHGNVEAVKLLVGNEANVNARCKLGETALCFAAAKTRENRVSIIRCLLETGAEVDATCSVLEENTPLMLAVQEFPDDLDSIKLLHSYHASLTITNRDKKTAVDISKETDRHVLSLLQPRDSTSGFGDAVHTVVSFLVSTLGWVNNAFGGVIGRLFNFSPPVDVNFYEQVKGDEGEELSVEDFKENLNQAVNDLGLDKFFSKGNNLLQTVAEKAAKLKDNPNTDLGLPHNVQKLTTVSMYQPVIYCDDSGSMRAKNQFQNQAKLVERICRITTYLVPDDLGIAIRFINQDTPDSDKLREDEVATLISTLKPGGASELGYNLRKKILAPLLYDRVGRDEELNRPLLISIITDGHPEGAEERDRMFIDVLKECNKFLLDHGYPKTAVRFQISQIGSEDRVKDFFNDLKSERQIQDMIYCTSDQLDEKYREMKDNEKGLEEWLLTTLMEPITQGTLLQSRQV